MPLINKAEYESLIATKKELEELKAELSEIDVDALPSAEAVAEYEEKIKKLEEEIKNLKANKVLNPSTTELTDDQRKAKIKAIKEKFKK